jgi:hypothetical protein
VKKTWDDLTEPQKRYAAVRKLIGCGEEILRRASGRPPTLADLHEDLKRLAAAEGLPYDSAMVVTAADIALRRILETGRRANLAICWPALRE